MCGCRAAAPLAPSTEPVRFSGTIFAMEGGRVGGPVPAAQLTIVNGANSNATVSTDAGGHYNFPKLATGKFNLTISAPGFVTLTPEVFLGQDLDVNFVLSPK
jgi:hypothetical protein